MSMKIGEASSPNFSQPEPISVKGRYVEIPKQEPQIKGRYVEIKQESRISTNIVSDTVAQPVDPSPSISECKVEELTHKADEKNAEAQGHKWLKATIPSGPRIPPNIVPDAVAAQLENESRPTSEHQVEDITDKTNEENAELDKTISDPPAYIEKAKGHVKKLRDDAKTARNKSKEDYQKERKKIVLLVAAVVGVVVCLALIGTGIGAIAGMSGLAVGLGLLALIMGAPAVGTLSAIGINKYKDNIDSFIQTRGYFNQKTEEVKTHNKTLEMMDVVKKDHLYHRFVEDLASQTLNTEEKIAMTPSVFEAYKKWQQIYAQKNKIESHEVNTLIIWDEKEKVQDKAQMHAQILEEENRIFLDIKAELLISNFKESNKSERVKKHIEDMLEEIDTKINELTQAKQDASYYEELKVRLSSAISPPVEPPESIQ